ncbi:30S ribosomal protein S17 [Thiomicrorhabdus sediminis]|uniref:Small ribosomal subunit protein uS17 n=1 Tax=Thiomicrorhabdus sediminis TaxID=2580412 RepID=A0A4P9K5A9_9GAMM|nr:30S ribosomal protein S17 [Thiomicrorhabdus sediminis]QCU89417.1 30S ribosomal protein S17 [Thiomicrorhabdus sediminis]
MADQVKKARTMQGVVVSNGMQDSIVVLTSRYIKHAKYKKFVKKSTKIMAHDAENACGVGDTVTIQETAPISKNKSWTLLSIDEKAKI